MFEKKTNFQKRIQRPLKRKNSTNQSEQKSQSKPSKKKEGKLWKHPNMLIVHKWCHQEQTPKTHNNWEPECAHWKILKLIWWQILTFLWGTRTRFLLSLLIFHFQWVESCTALDSSSKDEGRAKGFLRKEILWQWFHFQVPSLGNSNNVSFKKSNLVPTNRTSRPIRQVCSLQRPNSNTYIWFH